MLSVCRPAAAPSNSPGWTSKSTAGKFGGDRPHSVRPPTSGEKALAPPRQLSQDCRPPGQHAGVQRRRSELALSEVPRSSIRAKEAPCANSKARCLQPSAYSRWTSCVVCAAGHPHHEHVRFRQLVFHRGRRLTPVERPGRSGGRSGTRYVVLRQVQQHVQPLVRYRLHHPVRPHAGIAPGHATQLYLGRLLVLLAAGLAHAAFSGPATCCTSMPCSACCCCWCCGTPAIG